MEREWTLEPKKGSNTTVEEENPVKQCPECFYTVVRSTDTCPECGYEFGQDIEEVEQIESELVEVGSFEGFTTNYKEPEECKNMQELYEVAKARGYKNGWVWYTAKARGWIR